MAPKDYSRTRPRYVVTVWQWDRTEQGYALTARYHAAHSLVAAKRRADIEAAAMPSVETTWELRAYTRSGFACVQIERTRLDDGSCGYRYHKDGGFPCAPITIYTALAREIYVPSLGERGY